MYLEGLFFNLAVLVFFTVLQEVNDNNKQLENKKMYLESGFNIVFA